MFWWSIWYNIMKLIGFLNLIYNLLTLPCGVDTVSIYDNQKWYFWVMVICHIFQQQHQQGNIVLITTLSNLEYFLGNILISYSDNTKLKHCIRSNFVLDGLILKIPKHIDRSLINTIFHSIFRPQITSWGYNTT